MSKLHRRAEQDFSPKRKRGPNRAAPSFHERDRASPALS